MLLCFSPHGFQTRYRYSMISHTSHADCRGRLGSCSRGQSWARWREQMKVMGPFLGPNPSSTRQITANANVRATQSKISMVLTVVDEHHAFSRRNRKSKHGVARTFLVSSAEPLPDRRTPWRPALCTPCTRSRHPQPHVCALVMTKTAHAEKG